MLSLISSISTTLDIISAFMTWPLGGREGGEGGEGGREE